MCSGKTKIVKRVSVTHVCHAIYIHKGNEVQTVYFIIDTLETLTRDVIYALGVCMIVYIYPLSISGIYFIMKPNFIGRRWNLLIQSILFASDNHDNDNDNYNYNAKLSKVGYSDILKTQV
ncbi:hypothetical protein J3Q64DRAFT_1701912 [Phycomyces blakesleeanus]|uniref:Uncharacterized protein n=2 Tax=Phycomyces blakesleeanus TaxID=4837 RepID=A0A167KW21_PHYB8|nr:hypothetical protein PHYBLDRAFT_172854 [Phycomyces blakesleeanus NRRL 1555(-)]OAD69019.1 hypothetical protein PHYBLDRAFT_172854 [Phycomyces blakesleeanus NRRL 1555(-)]|eukprot:XP_018287059.1 hypothetical protein PHYBLDRAFT_172854 [Phycomyces blakesleeanus NRRL 1555(-)]